MSIVMLALLSLYIAGQKFFFNQDTRADTIEDSRYPMDWMARDIKESTQVALNSVSGTYSTSANELVLEVPSIDATRLIIDIDTTFDYITYRRNPQNPNRLERIIEANAASSRVSSTRVLADNVNALSFRFLDNLGLELTSNYDHTDSVEITLTSRQSGLGRAFQEVLNTKAKLRNRPVS
jgi:Tfp pilus assembly protein PilW